MLKKIKLESLVIDEIAKLGMRLPIDKWGSWHWLEKEIEHEGSQYLIGAYVQRDCIEKSIQIYLQQCLLKQ